VKEVKLSVGMRVFDQHVEMEMTLPQGPARLGALLPVFRRVADSLVELSARRAEEQGKTISCAKGCGACCRQIVPVAEVDARAIARLVDELPEPRRSLVRERFARAKERLAAAGFLSRLQQPGTFTAEEVLPFGLAYLRLGIACPFLEDECCSIYESRPITCREFLVTTPAVHCANPTPETVQWVEMASKVWTALSRADAGEIGPGLIPWVPLVLALDWAEAHPDTGSEEPVEKIVEKVFRELGRTRSAPPSPSAIPVAE
jgi:Fe-S-cluster containining protein